MVKVMVVEDIRREREMIIESVQWDELGAKIVGSAENGQEALIKMQESVPNIVITDIEMPVMDGITLAQQVRERYPNTKLIFLTSHSDFGYAKRAVDLSVESYVLKPIDSVQLTQEVKKVIDQCKMEWSRKKEEKRLREQLRESLPALREKFFKDLISGVYTDKRDILSKLRFFDINTAGSCYYIGVFEVDNYSVITEGWNEEQKQFLLLSLLSTAKNYVSNESKGILINVPGHRVAVLYMAHKTQNNINGPVYKWFYNMHHLISSKLGTSISLGLSNGSEDIQDVPRLYLQAVQALKYKLAMGKNSILVFEDLHSKEEIQIKMEVIHSNLKVILNSEEPNLIHGFVEQIFKNMQGNPNISDKLIQNLCFSILNYTELALLDINESFQSIFGQDNLPWEKLLKLETIVDIKQWILNILLFVAEYIKNKNKNKNAKLIEQTKGIIEEKYAEELTINDIADMVYLSPNYLNSIFKEGTGLTIHDYLIQYRIQKAKELLMDPSIKVYEVSELVGYKNKSYFTQLFKEHEGVTPNAYRKRV